MGMLIIKIKYNDCIYIIPNSALNTVATSSASRSHESGSHQY